MCGNSKCEPVAAWLHATVALVLGLNLGALAHAQSIADRAPTIQALSDLMAAERDRAAKARLEKLYPAPAPKPVPEQFENLVKQPDTPKVRQVLSIYGPAGREVADLVRADGGVETVRSGALFDGFRVLSVTADGVSLQRISSKSSRSKVGGPVRGAGSNEMVVGVGGYFH